MKAPITDGLDETYARMALRILTGPKDYDWHRTAIDLLDSAPCYGLPRDESGEAKDADDVYQVAGLILGYCAGLVEWTPED